MSTFAITGCGRSGTMWLSRIMNRSQAYTVEHEPDGADSAKYAYGRFYRADKAGAHYGEVNSRLRWCTLDLPIDKLGVIIRNPYDLARSSYNRGWGCEWVENDLEPSLWKLDKLLRYGAVGVEFERMVADLGCTSAFVKGFVSDVEVTQDDIETPCNQNKKYDDLPGDMCREVKDRCGWFVDKYYGGG